MSGEHRVTVRVNEVDRAGIAFFARVFEYCHATFEEMLMATPGSLTSVFDDGGWGMPLVHSEADFKSPMRMGDRLLVKMTIERLGKSSITFHYTLTGPDERLCATVRLVHALVDLESFTPCGIPEELRTNLDGLGLLPA